MRGKSEKGESMEWKYQNTKAFIEIIYDHETGTIARGKFNRLRLQHCEFSTLLSRTGVTCDNENNKVNAPGEIFNSSNATIRLSQTSTQEPPNFDEEREIEGNFLSKGVHIGIKVDVVVEGDSQDLDTKRKGKGSSSEHRHREMRNSRLETLEVALNTSPIIDPYSVHAFMKLLDSIEDISDKVYNKALDKFTNNAWRIMFIHMSTNRRNK
ncbi:hypothetical protein JHK87_039785 [Glycine soja]|nr:hypothetical protein JHK87_039785 [Glycine soja]